MKLINISVLLFFCILFTACFELDNYDGPDAGIDGTLLDVETGERIYTEQPDGCKIQLFELKYAKPTPLDFWVKATGDFRNVALFSGSYKVLPVEGPVFPVDTAVVKLKGVTKHDFKVTPFIKITLEEIVKGEAGSAAVTVKFRLKRSATPAGFELESKTISEARVLVQKQPIVSIYNGGYLNDHSVTRTLSRSRDTVIEETLYEVEVPDLKSGETYYLRVAALSSTKYNTMKRYNYTEIIEIVAP